MALHDTPIEGIVPPDHYTQAPTFIKAAGWYKIEFGGAKYSVFIVQIVNKFYADNSTLKRIE
jgi:hypothetical protein